MKKLLYAVAAFAVLFTSCAKDDAVAPVEDKEALVSFCVNSPAVATRYGEGEEATTLYWAVYNADGSIVEALQGSKEIKLSTTVDLKLIQGREYDVLFWAADAQAPYEVDWDAKTMTVKDVLTANQESYDAFFKYESLGTVNGALSKTIELRRPFAQLNIATGDTTDAANAEFEVAQTKVTVENVYKTLSFVDGTVSDEDKIVFDWADKANGTISVGDKSYDHIAMNYLLVGEKKLVNVTLGINNEVERKYSSVPVQRNYRTNIVGNILTSPAEFNVVILPGFEEDEHPFTDEDKLAMAAQQGGEYTLTEDVVLTSALVVSDKFTLDLNGHTVTNPNGYAIENTGILTINGGGQLDGMGGIRSNGGKLTINGGTYTGSSDWSANTYQHIVKAVNTEVVINGGTFDATIGGTNNAMINVSENSIVTINGGTFKNFDGVIPQFAPYMFTYEKNGKLIINGGTFYGGWRFNGETATTDIYGGIFTVSYDGQSFHANSTHILTIYGGVFSLDNGGKLNPANHIAEGYKVMEKDGEWHVVPADASAVAETPAEIISSLKQENAVVYVYPTEDGSAYKLEGKLSLANGVKLIGAGDEPVALFNDWGSNAFANQAHFTNTHIENVYFSNNLVIDAGIANGNVTFKGCVFGGDRAHQGVHFDSGNGVITFEDCTFVGRNMFGASLEKVIFNNCKFENKKSSLTGADKWTGVNMWGKYEFNNCEFDTEATCNVKCAGVEADFNNCFYSNGKDIKEVVKNASAHLCTIKFDGVKAASTVATTSAALNDAIAAGHTIIGLAAGEYTFPASSIKEGVTIKCEEGTVFTGTSSLNIKGATVEGATFSNHDGVAVSGTINGNFKDCTFEGSEALRWCYTNAGETSVFENCVIKTDFRGFHFDDMNGDVIFRNCEINGFNAYGGDGTATFEGCTFGNDDSSYNGLNIYANTVLKGCTFNYISGKTNFVDMEGVGKTLTIENCTATLDGVATEVSNFVGGSKVDQNTVIYK